MINRNINFKPNKFVQSRQNTNPNMIRNGNVKPLSKSDKFKLKKILFFIRAYYNFIKDDPEKYEDKKVSLYLHLNYFNDLLCRESLFNIKWLKKNKTISILLDLSVCEHKEIHACSLSILASLTYFMPSIIDELLENNFYDSINSNLQLESVPEKRHVFRWIYNFLAVHEDLAQTFFENVLLSDICQSSIDFLSNENDKHCQAMFLHIMKTKVLSIEQVGICFDFCNFVLENPKKKGIHYVLYGIHKILSNTDMYPTEFLCDLVVELNLEKIISSYIQDEKINRKKCFSFCLLADLYELGFQDNSHLISELIQIINIDDLTEWFLRCVFKSIYKILVFCDQELVTNVLQNGIDDIMNYFTVEAFYCISLFLNRIETSYLLNFISNDYIDYICLMIQSDEEYLIKNIITGFIRLVEAAELFNKLDVLSQSFLECDGFSKFEDRFESDDEIPSELLNQLQQTLNKL